MRKIPKTKVIERIQFENPWWIEPHRIDDSILRMTPRAYFHLFFSLVNELSIRRAIVLMGPRRVGKTVMLYQLVQELISQGIEPTKIAYMSVDNPVYNGLGLEELFTLSRAASGDDDPSGYFVLFDEVQYLPEWEVHLKSLVDSYRGTRFVVSGSAAAALRLKSNESGAGRFTEFLLPPLTFHEYLLLIGETDQMVPPEGEESKRFGFHRPRDIDVLNQHFLDYLNYGGYPEVILSPGIKSDVARYIRNDIIDKVLLRDLPSLYGIQDIQELNSLFTSLAYNTANELSLDALSKRAGVAKNTIKRYLEYLEAAFLVRSVHRIDRSGKRFQRVRNFKIYLTNPSIRGALFSPVGIDDADIGALVETAIFDQWFHSAETNLHYARWPKGEVDIVNVQADGTPVWAIEVKWSDRISVDSGELRGLIGFCKTHDLDDPMVTTRTKWEQVDVGGLALAFVPAAVYCYTLGYELIERKLKESG